MSSPSKHQQDISKKPPHEGGGLEGAVLVALSGGADSVCLLLTLLEQGESVEAVHCNFHLRGGEADRDEAFCRDLCQRKGVKLHIAHFDTRAYAELHKISIELAARQLRYNYFEQLRRDIGADCIAVAHHKDDQVETIIHNLVRGTGAKGLCGMRERNGYIVRPLLNVTRAEIEQRLRDWGETFVTDSTNLEDDATRNKIRHHIIPLLKEINPQAVDNIARMARRLAETCAIEQEYYDSLGGSITDIPREKITAGLLNHLLAPKGFNATQIDNILRAIDKPESKTFLTKDFILDICRHKLYLSPNRPDTFCESRTPAGNLMRRPKPGDRFRPKGRKGAKLVSDYLNEMKLTPPQKRQAVVVEDPQGKIIDVIV